MLSGTANRYPTRSFLFKTAFKWCKPQRMGNGRRTNSHLTQKTLNNIKMFQQTTAKSLLLVSENDRMIKYY